MPQPLILFAARDVARARPARIQLRRRGARVRTLMAAHELLDAIDRDRPDVVVIDDDLSPWSPRSLVTQIRARRTRTQTQIILIVSHPSLRVREGIPPLDLLFCAVKPVDAQTLADAVVSGLPDRLAPQAPVEHVPRKVVCVDDDAFYLSSLTRVLARQGYRVITFDRPEQALEAIPNTRPDLVMLDIRMPGMDGLSVLDKLREGPMKNVPVVLLTACTSDRDIAEGYRHGATYYVTKPAEPQRVLNAVDYLVGELDAEERALLETRL